jgi:hypothetical protein
MTLPAYMYRDPANHVKFERELIPCCGCAYLKTLFDKQYCDKGNKIIKKCAQFKEYE